MQLLYRSSRYLLPTLFLGYALVANTVFLERWDKPLIAPGASVLTGAVTADLDHVYKTTLPHRDLSIGLVGAARYLLTGEGRAGVIGGQDGWLFTNEESRPLTQGLDDAIAPILAVQDSLGAAGVRLVIVPIPAKMDIYSDKADQPQLSAAMATDYSRFVAALQISGVSVVDTRPALIHARDNGPVYFATDTHWNADGAGTVAVTVAASGLLPVGTTDFVTQSMPDQTFVGDLVSFVTSESLAPHVGLPGEHIQPYLAVAAKAGGPVDLFGTTQADIVLVGTSYSANPRWSFAEALKLALRQDVLNFAEEGQGPARPMETYLASSDFRDTPPRVVVWEFPVRYLSDPTIWDGKPQPRRSNQEIASAT